MLATIKQTPTNKGALQITFYHWVNNIHYERHNGWVGRGFLFCLFAAYIFSLICVIFFCLCFINSLLGVLLHSYQITKSFLFFFFVYFSETYFFINICTVNSCVNLEWKEKNLQKKIWVMFIFSDFLLRSVVGLSLSHYKVVFRTSWNI